MKNGRKQGEDWGDAVVFCWYACEYKNCFTKKWLNASAGVNGRVFCQLFVPIKNIEKPANEY